MRDVCGERVGNRPPGDESIGSRAPPFSSNNRSMPEDRSGETLGPEQGGPDHVDSIHHFIDMVCNAIHDGLDHDTAGLGGR